MKLYYLGAALMLAGCQTLGMRDAPLAVQYKYVVTTVPEELFRFPGAMYKIDPKTASESEMAKWMIDSENRYIEIEKSLKSVKEYQERKLRELHEKVDEKDIVRN